MGKKYGNLTSDTDYRDGTEFGGVDGMIQPPPHDVANVPHEQLKQIYQTDPAAGMIQYQDGHTDVEDQPIPVTKKISN